MIKPYFIEGGLATGSAGSASITNTSKEVITGRVVYVGIVPGTGTTPTTADAIIRTANKNHALIDVPIVTFTNIASGGAYAQPFALKDDTAGADIAANYVEPVIHDQVEVVIAQTDPATSLDVIILVEC
jgi:hypothetical protein